MNNIRNTYQIDKIDHYYYIKYDTNTLKDTHTGHSLHPFGTFFGKEWQNNKSIGSWKQKRAPSMLILIRCVVMLCSTMKAFFSPYQSRWKPQCVALEWQSDFFSISILFKIIIMINISFENLSLFVTYQHKNPWFIYAWMNKFP